MDIEGLFKIQDMNSIIKFFAFSIQERFQQLDGLPRNYSCHEFRYMSHQSMEESEHLIRKYRGYHTNQETQVKYLQKFVIRILQILQFFRQRSKSQHILALVIKKIQQKLNKTVKTTPVDVEGLYSYIIDLTKNGFQIKRTPFKDRRMSLKKMEVSDFQKGTEPKDNSKESEQIESRAISTANNINNKRRTVSLSAKRVNKVQMPKQSLQSQLSKMYSILEIDTMSLLKVAQNKERKKILQREQIKQNLIISNAISNYEKLHGQYLKKKQRSDTTLKEVNNRSSLRPTVNNWISRKRKMAECRKKQLIDSENVFQL